MHALRALRILIVDDNAQMRTIIGSVLSAAGVRFLRYAPDGVRGLQALEEFQPDLCYVDYEMPGLNGLGFTRAVRARQTADRYMPIIMLTGHSDLIRLNAARDAGVTEFLCKPASARSMLRRLESAIKDPRPFIDTPDYFGPDRRRRSTGAYAGPLRRQSDRSAHLEI